MGEAGLAATGSRNRVFSVYRLNRDQESEKMFSRITILRFLIAAVATVCGSNVLAQVKTVPLPTHTRPQYLVAIFPANVVQVDGAPVPVGGGTTVPAPSIYVKEGGRRIYL